MHHRILPTVGVSAVALVAAAALAPMATAGTQHLSPASGHHKAAIPAKMGPDATRPLCYSNLVGDSGVGIVSQNFEATFDAYDNQGADNFVLRRYCAAREIDAPGVYFNGIGPANSETVTFYAADPDGVGPGDVIDTQTVTGEDTFGTFAIPLKAVKLQPGRYWVSVQANLDFSSGGEWGWETTNTLRGKPAMWQNPGNGFGTGCTTYAVMQTCLGAQGEGPDFMFQIVH
jgi:hypothetical protein